MGTVTVRVVCRDDTGKLRQFIKTYPELPVALDDVREMGSVLDGTVITIGPTGAFK